MNEKEIIKYLDLIFEKIENFNSIGIGVILSEILGSESEISKNAEKFNKIVSEVSLFGENNDLFEKKGEWYWFKLTPKGKELKKSNLGFVKFSKKSGKKSMTNFEKWSLLLIALPIIINLIQWNYSSTLKSELESCNSELDSLKSELYSKKNIKIENIEKPLNKTLESKK